MSCGRPGCRCGDGATTPVEGAEGQHDCMHGQDGHECSHGDDGHECAHADENRG